MLKRWPSILVMVALALLILGTCAGCTREQICINRVEYIAALKDCKATPNCLISPQQLTEIREDQAYCHGVFEPKDENVESVEDVIVIPSPDVDSLPEQHIQGVSHDLQHDI